MHMRKIRTTNNLNEDVVKKAKSLGINISAVAERGIIDYIKEIENLRRNNDNSRNNNQSFNGQSHDSNSASKNIVDLSGFEPEASSMPRRRSSELIYKPILGIWSR